MNNNRVLIVLLVNFILWILIAEINHQLAPLSFSFQMDIVYLIFAGLYFRMIHGALFSAAMGLYVNAMTPLPFGTLFLAYIAMWFVVVWSRSRIRRENPAHVRVLAIVIQLVWTLILTVSQGSHLIWEFSFLFRIVTDLSLSLLIIMIFVYPWCEFQRNLMYSLGWDLNAEVNRP